MESGPGGTPAGIKGGKTMIITDPAHIGAIYIDIPAEEYKDRIYRTKNAAELFKVLEDLEKDKSISKAGAARVLRAAAASALELH